MTFAIDTYDFPTPRRASGRRYLVSPRLIATVAALGFVTVLMTSVQAHQPLATAPHVVEQGETLWSIAESVTTPGADVRETLVVVRDLNDLDGSTIHPGQVLLLPAG